MTGRRRVWQWVTDWRNGATLAATLLMVVVLLVVFDAIAGRREAFDALKDQTLEARESRRAASRRIDLLQARIDELIGRGEVNAQLLGELVADVEALRSQVRSLGGTPVVESAADRRAARTTTTRPPGSGSSSTTSTTQPAPRPDPGDPPDDDGPEPATPIPWPCSTAFVPVLCTEGDPP